MCALSRRALLMNALALPALPAVADPAADALGLARRIAGHYSGASTQAFYIVALLLSAQRRLRAHAALPLASQQALRARRDAAPASAPAAWPQRAGYAAFAEAARHDGDTRAGELAVQALRDAIVDTPQGPQLGGLRPWTDELFLCGLLADRALPLLPAAERPRAIDALGRTLQPLAARLQRADGLFEHADGAPVAWGRGNGFAALALVQALEGALPPGTATGRGLLAALQRQLRALLPLQRPDGLWRQVLDHADAWPELTATAMALTALARARRHGWLGGAAVDTAIAAAWAALQSRVDADTGTFRDVCDGTPAGPDLAFYLARPVVRGRDDRAAAVVMGAALALTA